MAWTKEQQKIIDSRNASILVSAAAGSGKTAVLVERVQKKIEDTENPCDIDEFLVVTFTHAAADQMKDKISSKIEKALEDNPEDEHLMKQLHLVNRANIMTIDSFCLQLVKEHFGQLGLDSSFTIGDTGMMELLRNDILDELFKNKFQLPKDSPERKNFELLTDIFSDNDNDDGLKKAVLNVYDTASSFPRIDEWLESAKKAVTPDYNDTNYIESISWMKDLTAETKSMLTDALITANRALELALAPGGPDKNIEKTRTEIERIEGALSKNAYEEQRQAISNISFDRLSVCKGEKYDAELVERYKLLRNTYKDIIKELKEIFVAGRDEFDEQMKLLSSYIVPLIELVQEFMVLYDAEKDKRKLLTFSDVEHMAHRLVCDGTDENGFAVPSEIGKNISKRFREIYIDEYQDSNYLQEEILYSVSRYHEGCPNMFMVGDVKQSIYKFRMARPDIFLEKYKRFGEEGNEIRIDLKNNFRSRKEVLNPVNFFFYQLMGADLGGITYSPAVALVPTKKYPEPPEEIEDRISNSMEICAIDAAEPEDADGEGKKLSEEELNLKKIVLEAHYIADRILEITDEEKGMYIYDEDEDTYRRARYKDIVILSRSIKGVGDNFYNVLSEKGIPVYVEDSKGYFDATEIRVILSMLAVIDNSRQDIPLAAVLMSPMAGLDENDLAKITDYAVEAKLKSRYLYDKCLCYIEDKDDEVKVKLQRIIDIINELKQSKTSMSIASLIYRLLELTGYYEYACAMPMGNRRKANIDLLLDKADKYENGYYKGLFNFLRYVDKLKTNEVDFGESDTVSEDEDVVRIISMHKSKGLEYPIVFVSGLGKGFNTKDTKDKVVINSDYYLTGYIYNTKGRFKSKPVSRLAFKTLLKRENIGEELRILYVAFTRAKEKLIVTGCDVDIEGIFKKYGELSYHEDVLLPYSYRKSASSFLRHIIMAMVRYDRLKTELSAGKIEFKLIDRAEVLKNTAEGTVKKGMDVMSIKQAALALDETKEYLSYRKNFEYSYPYEGYINLKGKMSISDIKKMKAFDGEEFEVGEYAAEPEEKSYSSDEQSLSGSERGTIVHKFMELLDFAECNNSEDKLGYIMKRLNQLVSDGVFDERESRAIYGRKIAAMVNSSLGQRMAAAKEKNVLFAEQQFSAGLSAEEIYDDLKLPATDDLVIVQGIIDAYFYEGDEIVVVDYKTDRGEEDFLIGKYRAQLDYYAYILQRLTGKRVKEKILYSFYLDREIRLP